MISPFLAEYHNVSARARRTLKVSRVSVERSLLWQGGLLILSLFLFTPYPFSPFCTRFAHNPECYEIADVLITKFSRVETPAARRFQGNAYWFVLTIIRKRILPVAYNDYYESLKIFSPVEILAPSLSEPLLPLSLSFRCVNVFYFIRSKKS